jgi:AraC-like DNA-binding protein
MASPSEPFEYIERRPTGLLGIYVESIWFARGLIAWDSEFIAPTGSTVGAIVLGDPIRQWPLDTPEQVYRAERGFLIGAHDRPIVNRPEGRTFCVGVVATPVGCAMTFGVAAEPLKRRIVGLAGTTLDGSELAAELRALAEPESILDLVTSMLAARVSEPDVSVRRCRYVIDALTADPTRSIDGLAYELSISHGHLDQEFKTVVGLGPRALARVLRLRALLAQVDEMGIQTWAQVATDGGWFDQPHLIRDFRRHTGVTPREYVRARKRQEYPGGLQPGFVPHDHR